jgi:hypothetical protein
MNERPSINPLVRLARPVTVAVTASVVGYAGEAVRW